MPPARPPREDLVTVTIAAYRLAVARRTVLRWIHAGTIPFRRYPSGQYRISGAVIAKIQGTLGDT